MFFLFGVFWTGSVTAEDRKMRDDDEDGAQLQAFTSVRERSSTVGILLEDEDAEREGGGGRVSAGGELA